MDKIFSDYGIEIFACDGNLLLQYDSEEILSHLTENVICEEDAILALVSEIDAYWDFAENELN